MIQNLERAKGLGLIGTVVNLALSIGEGAYNAFDRAEQFLVEQAAKRRENKINQPKTRLSKRKKKEILKRNGQ